MRYKDLLLGQKGGLDEGARGELGGGHGEEDGDALGASEER